MEKNPIKRLQLFRLSKSSPRHPARTLSQGLLGFAALALTMTLSAPPASAGPAQKCKAKLRVKASNLDPFDLGTITGRGWKKDGSAKTNRGRAVKAVTACVEAALENNSNTNASNCTIDKDANERGDATETIVEYNLNPNLKKQIQAELCSRAQQKGMDGFTDGHVYIINLTDESGCERGNPGTSVLTNFSVRCSGNSSSFHSDHKGQSLAAGNQRGTEGLEKMRKHCDSVFKRALNESSVKFSVADERLGTLKATFDCR
jgi:hypothetical protein